MDGAASARGGASRAGGRGAGGGGEGNGEGARGAGMRGRPANRAGSESPPVRLRRCHGSDSASRRPRPRSPSPYPRPPQQLRLPAGPLMVGTNLASSGGGARRRPRGPSPRDWYHLPSYPNTLPGGGGSSLGCGSRGCGRGRAQPGLGSRELTRAWPLPAPPSHPASILAVPGAQLGSPSQRVIVSGLASWGAGLWDRGAEMRSGAGGCSSLLGSRHPAGGGGCRGTCVWWGWGSPGARPVW